MGKNIGKNISKDLPETYSRKRLDHTNQVCSRYKTTSKKIIQKTAEATSDLIGNKISNRITKVWTTPEAVRNENDKEIPKEICIYLQKKGRKLSIIEINIIV